MAGAGRLLGGGGAVARGESWCFSAAAVVVVMRRRRSRPPVARQANAQGRTQARGCIHCYGTCKALRPPPLETSHSTLHHPPDPAVLAGYKSCIEAQTSRTQAGKETEPI